jgi:hypothetical protein
MYGISGLNGRVKTSVNYGERSTDSAVPHRTSLDHVDPELIQSGVAQRHLLIMYYWEETQESKTTASA